MVGFDDVKGLRDLSKEWVNLAWWLWKNDNDSAMALEAIDA